MKKLLFVLFALALAGCGPKQPAPSLILWGQPSPKLAALAHVQSVAGTRLLLAFEVMPTGSMEPFLTGGDWVVADWEATYETIKASDLVLYQANWLPPTSLLVVHMAAAQSGDEWIMDGIANAHYERGSYRMGRAEYRAKVIQIYTKREKP